MPKAIGLPGLVIDRFGDTLDGADRHGGHGKAARRHCWRRWTSCCRPQTVILRNDAPSRALEGLEPYVRAVKGEGHRIAVEENGARYIADLAEGQKTGWYYDQRDNRAFIAGFAKGKSVLDAYSYTGGFGILAAKAGAKEVICLDSSAPALALAEESAARQRRDDPGGQGRCVRGTGAADRGGAKSSTLCWPIRRLL